jgi:hypothetical protein
MQMKVVERLMAEGYHIRHDDSHTVLLTDGNKWVKVLKDGSVVQK